MVREKVQGGQWDLNSHCSLASSVWQGHGVLSAKNVDKNVDERDEKVDGKKLEQDERRKRKKRKEERREGEKAEGSWRILSRKVLVLGHRTILIEQPRTIPKYEYIIETTLLYRITGSFFASVKGQSLVTISQRRPSPTHSTIATTVNEPKVPPHSEN